jgi:hypothetical protein
MTAPQDQQAVAQDFRLVQSDDDRDDQHDGHRGHQRQRLDAGRRLPPEQRLGDDARRGYRNLPHALAAKVRNVEIAAPSAIQADCNARGVSGERDWVSVVRMFARGGRCYCLDYATFMQLTLTPC